MNAPDLQFVFRTRDKPAPSDCEVIPVIRTTLLRKGNGTGENPTRCITQYWSVDGELLWEVDPWEAAKAVSEKESTKNSGPPHPPGYAHLLAGYVSSAFACLRDAQFHPQYQTFDQKARNVIETARDLLQRELEEAE